MNRPLYIFDLDGTLALIEHRRHFVTAPMVACECCNGSGVVQTSGPTDWANGKPGKALSRTCWDCRGHGVVKDPNFKPDWDAFYDACVDDKPNWPVIRTLMALSHAGYEIQIWSGRSEAVRGPTDRWLLSCVNVTADKSIIQNCATVRIHMINCTPRMRPEGDSTPDEQLKESWLKAMPQADRARLVAVFDDRQKVVNMWRENGVTCFQVAPGAF